MSTACALVIECLLVLHQIGLLTSCIQETLDRSPLGVIALGLLDSLISSVQNEQSLLICGVAVELLHPYLCNLATCSHNDIPKTKVGMTTCSVNVCLMARVLLLGIQKVEIPLLPPHIPKSLEEALLPLMVKRRSGQLYRSLQLASLQLRVIHSVCRRMWIPDSAGSSA